MTPLWQAYRAWRGLAGPLADYVLPAPFLAPWNPVPCLPQAAGAGAVVELVARRAAPADADEQTAVFLEASPRLGLAAGWRLGGAGWAVAPLYGRWPAPGAVLPAERLTSWLLAVAGALRAPATPRPARAGGAPGARPLCLLLDAERERRVSPATLRRRFDNRYDYPDYLFPPPQRLRGWGVGRAVWAGPSAAFPPGLQDYAEGLVRAGISLDLLRLPPLPARGRLPVGPGVPAGPCAP
ncbi:MAG TPA: hypothetical protein VH257_05005 [Chloroflexota bacterium]|nr:hypothetical protein [Chloroflexota bacterium]